MNGGVEKAFDTFIEATGAASAPLFREQLKAAFFAGFRECLLLSEEAVAMTDDEADQLVANLCNEVNAYFKSETTVN